MYVVKTGCQWRALPHDYPPCSTVYNFYSRAKQKGTWEEVMQFLVKETRIKAEKDAEPSYALIDSQSVKTAYRSDKKGYDEGYRGTFKNMFETFRNIRIDISKQIKPKFEIMPKRWCIERTFAWFGGYRRLAKDVEYTALSEENIIYISQSHLLLKRL